MAAGTLARLFGNATRAVGAHVEARGGGTLAPDRRTREGADGLPAFLPAGRRRRIPARESGQGHRGVVDDADHLARGRAEVVRQDGERQGLAGGGLGRSRPAPARGSSSRSSPGRSLRPRCRPGAGAACRPGRPPATWPGTAPGARGRGASAPARPPARSPSGSCSARARIRRPRSPAPRRCPIPPARERRRGHRRGRRCRPRRRDGAAPIPRTGSGCASSCGGRWPPAARTDAARVVAAPGVTSPSPPYRAGRCRSPRRRPRCRAARGRPGAQARKNAWDSRRPRSVARGRSPAGSARRRPAHPVVSGAAVGWPPGRRRGPSPRR